MQQDEAITYLTKDSGRVPCSRYGWDSRSCAPVAWATASIVAGANGEIVTVELLDHMMSLVVNNHDDPEDLIRDYGREYGFDPEEILD